MGPGDSGGGIPGAAPRCTLAASRQGRQMAACWPRPRPAAHLQARQALAAGQQVQPVVNDQQQVRVVLQGFGVGGCGWGVMWQYWQSAGRVRWAPHRRRACQSSRRAAHASHPSPPALTLTLPPARNKGANKQQHTGQGSAPPQSETAAGSPPLPRPGPGRPLLPPLLPLPLALLPRPGRLAPPWATPLRPPRRPRCSAARPAAGWPRRRTGAAQSRQTGRATCGQ